MSIKVSNVIKSYENETALKGIDLTIKKGELVALLGPSGSGKTTLLRIIAGLENPDSGEIFFEDQDVANVQVKERNVGFVFQHYALFQHMTVFENIAFGLKVRPRATRPLKRKINEKVMELLSLVKLESFANRFPSQLSGGQRQRVALARALAVEPSVLLLDEPFGALDAKVRKDLRRWLRKLHDEIHITSIFVTHDQEEALEVADRVVIMNGGMIEQIGTPEEVYHTPASPFVYDFLGKVNLFHGRINKGSLISGGLEIPLPELVEQEHKEQKEVTGYVRPHQITIEKFETNQTSISAIVTHIHAVGPIVYVEVLREDTNDYVEIELMNELFYELKIQLGERVFVRPNELKVFIPQDYSI
ncbi:sulfate/molybdate ABC transporter ATP-binding protein [Gottfriedia acidiceleris]|uniref:sulfate/molybdate ABC transporter ATP-binding protein n=1 Tax=Gottfriedia acidiceleris TaxID=371036 RepID=UPI002F265AB7